MCAPAVVSIIFVVPAGSAVAIRLCPPGVMHFDKITRLPRQPQPASARIEAVSRYRPSGSPNRHPHRCLSRKPLSAPITDFPNAPVKRRCVWCPGSEMICKRASGVGWPHLITLSTGCHMRPQRAQPSLTPASNRRVRRSEGVAGSKPIPGSELTTTWHQQRSARSRRGADRASQTRLRRQG